MTNQNYLIIESGLISNVCVWDGNTETWIPPVNSIQLPQDTTPVMLWVLNPSTGIYGLVQSTGSADIGFTWDGEVATTNELQPPEQVKPESIPVTTP
jgi:hypothetical protein